MAELTFEQAMAELEEIVKKLEEGRMPLEAAVKAFERGSELKKICEEKLKDAQLKIEVLSGEITMLNSKQDAIATEQESNLLGSDGNRDFDIPF